MSEPTYQDNPFSGLFDTVSESLRLAVEASSSNDMKILGLLDHVADRLSGHDAEVQELREGMAALSNRIEAVTRLHSVKA